MRKPIMRDRVDQLRLLEAEITFKEFISFVYEVDAVNDYEVYLDNCDKAKSLLSRMKRDNRNEIGVSYDKDKRKYKFTTVTKCRKRGHGLPRYLSARRTSLTAGEYYTNKHGKQPTGVRG